MDEQRALKLQKLVKHEAFDALREELEAAETRYFDGVRKRAMIGQVTDQRELDFMRGKFSAGRFILKQPHKAAAFLAKLEQETEEE